MKQMNRELAAIAAGAPVRHVGGLLRPTAAKKPWEKIKIPELNEIKMPDYERVELDNGMILYLAEDHEFPLVELSATIDVGASTSRPTRSAWPA